MNKLTATLLLGVTLGALTIIPNAMADPWDQKTVFTFGGPVEIPGQVLPAGTYVFKLANSQSNRNIVQVFSKDEKHVIGTFLAIPDYRLQPSDKALISFEERAAGTPEAIKAWFYPGKNYGHEFVYPKPKAIALAKMNNTPVPAMPAEMAQITTHPSVSLKETRVAALATAPLKAEKPGDEEVELAEVFIAPTDPQPADTLPTTASATPFIGLLGLLSLAAAAALKLSPARVK